MLTSMETARYDPRIDAAVNWPSWYFEEAALVTHREEIHVRSRHYLFDMCWTEEEREWAIAHAVAHLDHGDHLKGHFTEQDEMRADWTARERLGRPKPVSPLAVCDRRE